MTSNTNDQPSHGASETEASRPALTEANLSALQAKLAASNTSNSTASNVIHLQHILCLIDV